MTVETTDYTVRSRTIRVDSVLATTNDCRLGRVVDPETHTLTTCNFLAQFHILENIAFPARENMIVKDGVVQADSCDIRVYIRSYYGDSLNTMKIKVHELDTSRVMEENDLYYTTLNPENYLNRDPSAVQRTLTFSTRDLSVADTLLNSSSYYQQIRVNLPKDYATYLLNMYYAHPEYFRDSYEFIHHVCPGFYFQTVGGVGTMVNVDISALNLYFRYHVTNENGNDTIVDGMQRMGATAEVIQSTQVANEGLDGLVNTADQGYTYLKTPSGLFTEVELPVSDVVAGEHYTDTINSASIAFVRRNNEVNSLLETAGSDIEVTNNSTLNNAVRNAAAEVASSGSTSSVDRSIRNAMGWKASDVVSSIVNQFLGSLGIIGPDLKLGLTAVVKEEDLKNNTGSGGLAGWIGNTSKIAPINTPEKYAATLVLAADNSIGRLSDLSENRIRMTYNVAGSKATAPDGTVYWVFAAQIQIAS